MLIQFSNILIFNYVVILNVKTGIDYPRFYVFCTLTLFFSEQQAYRPTKRRKIESKFCVSY